MVCVLVYMRVRDGMCVGVHESACDCVCLCVWRVVVVVVVYCQVKLKNEKAKNIAAANVRLD